MKLLFTLAAFVSATSAFACDKCANYDNLDFKIKQVTVQHDARIAATVWEITVEGTAGKTTAKPAGQLNGAPVLGYVFPTNLASTDVGFSATEGIVALALTLPVAMASAWRPGGLLASIHRWGGLLSWRRNAEMPL